MKRLGRRRILLGCWGSFNNPDVCDYTYEKMTDWGRGMFVTPGVVVDGQLVTTDLVDINLNIRILLGSSYYDDWQNSRPFVEEGSAGQSGRSDVIRGTRARSPARRSATSKTNTLGSCLLAGVDKRTGDYLALDTGGGPIARFWSTRSGRHRRYGLREGDRPSVIIRLPKTALKPEMQFEWKIPKWSNAIERDRARTYFQAYAAPPAMYFVEQALQRGACRPHANVE